MALQCDVCPLGYFAPAGSASCTPCAQQYYADAVGMTACIFCPAGRTTPAIASISLDQCVSPEVNFYMGYVAIALVVPLAIEYVLHARFHRVAFLRKERVVEKLIMNSRAIMKNLYRFVSRGEAERERSESNRKLKTWVFIFKNGEVKSVEVKTGLQDIDYFEITEGLKGGEEIVAGPVRIVAKELNDGDKVKKAEKGKEDKKEEK